MISIASYTADQVKTWDDFVNRSKMPMFMFNRGFMDYHADRFQDASLMFYRDDELLAVLPASRHGDEIRSHGGLTYGGMISGEKMKQHTMLECVDAMRDFYRATGVSSVLYKSIPHIYHRQPAEEDAYALFRNGATLVKVEPSTVVNLAEPLKMPKGRKAQISRARREGVEVRETDDFEAFIALENEALKRHDVTAVHTASELRLLTSRFPNNIKCICGFLSGKLIAGTVLFVYDHVVHTQYLCADEHAREIGALDLVVSGCIAQYRMTHRWLDFGISSEDGGAWLNEGLIAQKEGFGGRTGVYETWGIDI